MSRYSPLSFALAASLAVTLAGCDRQSASDTQPREEVAADEGGELEGIISRDFAGEPLPRFTASHPDGSTLELSNLKGTPVLLNLWATWCAPCVLEMPMLEELALEHEGRLRVVTVSQDMKGAEKVSPFFAERGFEALEPWLDPKNDLAFENAVGEMPTTMLYDAEGKEIARVVGGYDWTGEEAAALLAEAL